MSQIDAFCAQCLNQYFDKSYTVSESICFKALVFS